MRIRSIHPDILTDPDLAEASRDARLLFVYSLIVADDAGNLEDSPKALRMACFPGDDDLPAARIGKLRDALIAGRFYEPYEVSGKKYLHIRNFLKYQKPDHPTAPKHPLPPGMTFTYHVRQGNTFLPRTIEGTLPEPKANVPRTLPEPKANVRAGEDRTGEDRTGEDRKGEDRKGGERGGKPTKPKPDARPLAFGGQAASSSPKDGSNGDVTTKASGKEGAVKIAALEEVARLVRIGEIDLAGASDKLRNTYGFTSREINEPALLQFLQQAANQEAIQ